VTIQNGHNIVIGGGIAPAFLNLQHNIMSGQLKALAALPPPLKQKEPKIHTRQRTE
jgi:hypothetical protein